MSASHPCAEQQWVGPLQHRDTFETSKVAEDKENLKFWAYIIGGMDPALGGTLLKARSEKHLIRGLGKDAYQGPCVGILQGAAECRAGQYLRNRRLAKLELALECFVVRLH